MLVKSSAKLRFVSIPPRKMRLVANTVKGLPVEKALAILNFTPRIAAHHLAKTVKSAAANALSKEGTDNLSPEALVVKNIVVDAAPTAKRIRFRSMGRVFRYRKRFCHLTVELEGVTEQVEQKPKAAPKTAKGKTAGKKTTKTKAKAKTKTKTAAKKKPAAKKTTKAKTAKKPAAAKSAPKTTKAKAAPKKKKEEEK